MNNPVLTVNSNGENLDDDSRPTATGPARAQGAPGPRFTHASGARPLDGYTIRRGLGHGGFGEVYYATSDAGKEVALKLIRRNLEVELRGIRHCLNLKHPNLLAIFDIREDDQGDKWVVMEYISGQCMETVIDAHPEGLPTEQALAWIHGIGAAVAYLHDHGIVHRDLKPGNIFAEEGVVKVGDYGLSKFISCSRRSGQTESVGTVHYMAPEVANGRYGKEIDVYALGIILYELLTGHVPFEGESVGEVLMKHLTATPDVSRLAEPYRTVVARTLAKDPSQRYSSVPEMLAALPRPTHPQLYAGPCPTIASGVRSEGGPAVGGPLPQAVNDEEPILRAVRDTGRRMYNAWNESTLNTPTKIVLLIAGLFVFLATAQTVLPILVIALLFYGVYYCVRSVVRAFAPPRPEAVDCPPGPPPLPSSPAIAAHAETLPHGTHVPTPGRIPAARRPPGELPVEALVVKPLRERVTELVGSLLASALVALTVCLVMVMLGGFRSHLPRPEQATWLAIMSVAGAWAVLIPSKFWEGARGDPMLRRFILMVVGLGLGVLAAGLAWVLQLSLPPDPEFVSGHGYELPTTFYADGSPQMLAYMACFATLLAVIRWWRQADPLRSTRMSLWSMGFCALVAWIVAAVWLFPQPWLMMVACAMSVAVQLASPWVHPRLRRARIREG
jgi:serine/threonine protein kinase